MLSALCSILLAFSMFGIPKDCPLFDRQYKLPPINNPRDISKDPLPKEKP
jgi:hypothetical protein